MNLGFRFLSQRWISKLPERNLIDFDFVIVGAGPAGLSAALRLKQLDSTASVVVLEKASQLGITSSQLLSVLLLLGYRWS